MEIFLALVVITAVIIFGALISMGNERQRKAIDTLREQTELWAVQDLRIKREKLAREIKVDNPLEWLNKIITKVTGLELNMQLMESFYEPGGLRCVSENQDIQILIAPYSPKEIKRMKREQSTRLDKFGKNNPLLFLPRSTSVYEISVLNAGAFFDIELQQVWKELTQKNSAPVERLWVYLI